jgi:hypothetical protein
MKSTGDLSTENQQLKNSAKRNKVILLMLLVLMVCLTVFAFTQRLEAQQQKERSDYLMEELLREKADAEQAQAEAMTQRELANINQEKYYQALQECEQESK